MSHNQTGTLVPKHLLHDLKGSLNREKMRDLTLRQKKRHSTLLSQGWFLSGKNLPRRQEPCPCVFSLPSSLFECGRLTAPSRISKGWLKNLIFSGRGSVISLGVTDPGRRGFYDHIENCQNCHCSFGPWPLASSRS
jgi:hypothetical protein